MYIHDSHVHTKYSFDGARDGSGEISAILDAAIAALDAGVPLDASCVDAELAMSAVGEVDGRAVGEDIVADIFSHFCVGK